MAKFFESDPSDVEAAFDLKDRSAEKRLYTVANVLSILKSLFPGDFTSLKEGFFKMLAFDAFIGAPDRHGMNWGVLTPLATHSLPIRFAPVFDTARGLFREISDDDLLEREERQGRRQFLANYAEGSYPILGTGQPEKQNHFSLIKWTIDNGCSEDYEAMRKVFDAVDICSIEHMLQRNFRRIITQYRIEFIRDLLLLRIQRIRGEIQQ